jgi:signal transduction histidine kinase
MEGNLQQEQKLEALKTLAGGIAHNFNNLNMGIQGNASLMLLETDPAHPNFEKLKRIEKLVQKGSKLINQLLGYAGEGRYEVKRVGLNQLLEEISESLLSTKEAIDVHMEMADDLFAMQADQRQIEQILQNLLLNAMDAMPHGGDLYLRTMNVTHADMTDKPYQPKPGNYVLFTITDTGVGMDQKTLERIFEPFFSTKGLGKGLGLGLASVYGIVKAQGGYIDVHSKKGRGTSFQIYLPASERKVSNDDKSCAEILKIMKRPSLRYGDHVTPASTAQILRKKRHKKLSAQSDRA